MPGYMGTGWTGSLFGKRMWEQYEPEPRPGLDDRSDRTVAVDRWDRRSYVETAKQVPVLDAVANDLAKVAPIPAKCEVEDVFALLVKARPRLIDAEEVRDDHRINAVVNEALIEDENYSTLHDLCWGDPIGAAMTVATWTPKLVELYERYQSAQRRMEDLQQEREKLLKMLKDLKEKPMRDQEREDAEQKAKEQEDKVDQQSQAADDNLEAMELAIGRTVAEMVEQGVQDRSAEETLSRSFGHDEGELKRMNADERMKLAKLLHSPRFKHIADYFGPMRNLVTSHTVRRKELPEEMVGEVRGSDPLDRLVPDQLAMADDPDLEMVFLSDIANGGTWLYDYEGEEEVGAGGLVVCIDESGSMNGNPDHWAKAVALVLMNIAKKHKRPFHVIHFDSSISQQSFPNPASFTSESAITLAETFRGGGTDFKPPLKPALKFLQANTEDGKSSSDIVFITDGEPSDLREDSQDTDKWLTKFHDSMGKIAATTWGIAIGGTTWSLEAISQGKVIDVQDLQPKSTRSLKKIFDGIQRNRVLQERERRAS